MLKNSPKFFLFSLFEYKRNDGVVSHFQLFFDMLRCINSTILVGHI